MSCEVDMTRCVSLRKDIMPLVEAQTGYKISYNELIVKATAIAINNHPNINVSLIDDEIIHHKETNIGIAVALDDGIVVPVIKNANEKGLASLTKKSKTMTKLARDGKLPPEKMKNGTFTISNLGMYEIDIFTPIINQPESAILGVGRITEKPVVHQGEIALRFMMTLSLSFDHRIIDGVPAAAFLTDLKKILENPNHLML
nr:dihydrolipoamide acetyltransferase family protein [Oceanobacillus senegalensis]